MSFASQDTYDIAMEWGLPGLARISPSKDAVIIVDVLSFSTCVSIAVDKGAKVSPFRWKDDRASEHARAIGAELAGARNGQSKYSLSPRSMMELTPGALLVLPSPNGSHLSAEAAPKHCLAGCLRNAAAVARSANGHCGKIAVIAAGERWESDGSLRPCLEDLIGAGAIIHGLRGSKSPEARMAESVFLAFEGRLPESLLDCSSGRELVGRGFTDDVLLASQLNVSQVAPVLRDGFYVPCDAD